MRLQLQLNGGKKNCLSDGEGGMAPVPVSLGEGGVASILSSEILHCLK